MFKDEEQRVNAGDNIWGEGGMLRQRGASDNTWPGKERVRERDIRTTHEGDTMHEELIPTTRAAT